MGAFDFSAGAGGVAESLEAILKQKFLEQIEARRAQEAQQRIGLDTRRLDQDATQFDQRLGFDRDHLGQQGRQFDVTSGQAGQRIAMDQEAQPSQIGLRIAQTKDLDRQPQEALDARTATTERDKTLHGYGMEQTALQGRNSLRVANVRGDNAPVVKIQTVDADGNPITKVLSRSEASGQDFTAGPTTDQRNRQAASGRAGAVLSAIAELSEKINTGQGLAAKATGEAAKIAAQGNLNDDVSEYEAVVSGFTPLLARAVGHTGVLTEQDVQSVRRMLPAPGDSQSVRDRKIARIQSLMGSMSGPSSGPNSGGDGAVKDPFGIR